MPKIALQIHVFTNALLKLGSTNQYEDHVSQAELVPTTPVVRFKGVGGGSAVKAGTPTWVLNLNLAQDWATANSLSTYLADNAGTIQPFTLEPEAGEDGWTGEVLIVASNIGGTVDQPLTGSVTLEVVGQPERVPAA